MFGRALETSMKYFQSYMSASNKAEKPRLAFLGPLGTYTHQAAFEYFGDSVEYTARSTITEVQQALSARVPFGVVPQENSTNGSVIETYNILRVPAVGQETFVRGATVLEVKHSLVTRRGVKLEDIKKVMSHEQALGQCREWLSTHLPGASLVHTDSTASAAKMLLSTGSELDLMKCAAICSSVVVNIYEGLHILQEGIQDGPENFTRFYVLSHDREVPLPTGCTPSTGSAALLRLHAPLSGDSVNSGLNIPKVMSVLSLGISRIDRRPNIHARSFDDVYFFEVGPIPGQSHPDQPWTKQVEQAADQLECMGVEVSVLGCW